METFTIDRERHYYSLDSKMMLELFGVTTQKHYPHRRPPKKWPDMKLIGKAMAKGWATPCRYYPYVFQRGGRVRSFVFPGITDAEIRFIHTLMRNKEI